MFLFGFFGHFLKKSLQFVFEFSAVVFILSPHIKNSTSHNALLSLFWTAERQSTAAKFGRKQTLSNQIPAVSASYVFLSVLSICSPKVLVFFLMKLHVFTFWSFVVVVVSEEGRASSRSSGLCGTNSELVLCVHGHKQYVSAEKKLKKKQKVKKKIKKRSGCICSDSVLFIEMKKKILTLNKVDKE